MRKLQQNLFVFNHHEVIPQYAPSGHISYCVSNISHFRRKYIIFPSGKISLADTEIPFRIRLLVGRLFTSMHRCQFAGSLLISELSTAGGMWATEGSTLECIPPYRSVYNFQSSVVGRLALKPPLSLPPRRGEGKGAAAPVRIRRRLFDIALCPCRDVGDAIPYRLKSN